MEKKEAKQVFIFPVPGVPQHVRFQNMIAETSLSRGYSLETASGGGIIPGQSESRVLRLYQVAFLVLYQIFALAFEPVASGVTRLTRDISPIVYILSTAPTPRRQPAKQPMSSGSAR